MIKECYFFLILLDGTDNYFIYLIKWRLFCFKLVRKTDVVKYASICQNIKKPTWVTLIKKKNMIITTEKERSSVNTQLFIILFVICWRNYMQWAGRSKEPSTDIFIH